MRKSGVISDKTLRIHTKFVPDLNCLQHIDRKYVENIIHRSLNRLQVECIDLVQFHWWNWEVKNYLQVIEWLFLTSALFGRQNGDKPRHYCVLEI